MSITAIVFVIIITIILSAFFSGMEIAFVSSNKLRIEMITKNNTSGSKILSKITKNPSLYISTLLVGNNFTLVLYGMFMEKILSAPLNNFTQSSFVILLLQTVISTLLILIVGEFLPKVLFRINNYFIVKNFSFIVVLFYIIFFPITYITTIIANFFVRIFFKQKSRNEQKTFTRFDIEEILEKARGINNSNDTEVKLNNLKIIQNAMDFSTIKVRECMCPRNKINAVPVSTDMQKLAHRFIESGYSNILVFKENIDEIIGYINVKDIFKRPQKLRNILRQIKIVQETMYIKELLNEMIKHNRSIAVVVDEFGSTSGIITIEDILEEIFGEIEDEHDISENKVIIKDDNYIISGLEEVSFFNEKYGFSLSEYDDYETIAGYILFNTDNLPAEGEVIEIKDDEKTYKFKILKVSDTKIEKVMLYH